jgi:ribosomal protein L29
MALLKYKDIPRMDVKEREAKVKDLRFELTKASATSNKQNAKTKEIKKAIARLLTFSNKAGEVKNK